MIKLYIVVNLETNQPTHRPNSVTALGYTKKGYATARAKALDTVWTKEYDGDGRYLGFKKERNNPSKYGVKEVEIDLDNAKLL